MTHSTDSTRLQPLFHHAAGSANIQHLSHQSAGSTLISFHDNIAVPSQNNDAPGNVVSSRRIIYTPSSFARQNLLYLQETGSLQARKPHTSARSHLASYLFFYVRSGAGQLSFHGKETRLHPGDCVFLDCRQSYSHTTANDLWALSWVHFNSSFMPGIYEKYEERGGQSVFHPENAAPFRDALDELYNLASGEDYIRDMKINEVLSGLLTLLMNESWNPERQAGGKAPKRESIRAVRDYLDAHYAEHITLDGLAKANYINKYYLTRVFREQYAASIGSYLLHVRITHAKELLRFSSDSIAEIGAAVGIPDPHYFARAFRQVEGMTPGEYRKSW